MHLTLHSHSLITTHHSIGLVPVGATIDIHTDLILLIEELQLVVDEAVLGALLLPHGPLFLQLGTPEGLYAVHAGAEFLVGQFQFLLEVSELALQVRVLRLELAEEERRGLPAGAVIVFFRWWWWRVAAVIVALQGLVAERPRSRPMVRPGGGRPAALVGRRGRLIVPREVRTPAGRGPVHLGEPAARTARPLLPAPLLARPLLLTSIFAQIQLVGCVNARTCRSRRGAVTTAEFELRPPPSTRLAAPAWLPPQRLWGLIELDVYARLSLFGDAGFLIRLASPPYLAV